MKTALLAIGILLVVVAFPLWAGTTSTIGPAVTITSSAIVGTGLVVALLRLHGIDLY